MATPRWVAALVALTVALLLAATVRTVVLVDQALTRLDDQATNNCQVLVALSELVLDPLPVPEGADEATAAAITERNRRFSQAAITIDAMLADCPTDGR